MSKHLFGIVLTPFGTAANNRGETEGNTTTLQKLLWKGNIHTTVSAEAIRAALRWYWQGAGQTLNRTWDENKRAFSFVDPEFARSGRGFIDDDVLGYMSARAAKQEGNDAENAAPIQASLGVDGSDAPAPARTRGARAPRAAGTADIRRGRLEVTRAISLQPWAGDVTFNAASPGATPSASRVAGNPVPYSAEVHATRYQFGFALTPSDLIERSHAVQVLDALSSLSNVAGNHARFLYDFAPASIILRWTDDPAPRFLYAFETDDEDAVSAPRLVSMVGSGDMKAGELWVGGEIARTAHGEALREAGCHVSAGVKGAFDGVRQLVAGTA
jgi:CRISPR-associated protein Cst2